MGKGFVVNLAIAADAERQIGRIGQRTERLGQPFKVPAGNLRLAGKTVTATLRVRGIRRPGRIEVVDPAVGAIVDGQPEDRHVVGIHHPMHEANAHPVHHQARRALANLGKPACYPFLGRTRQGREIASDGEFDESAQQFRIATRSGQLKVAEADERRRDAADDGAGFGLRVTVVEHVAHHFLARFQQGQCTRCRHAKMVHSLAAQEFADRRAQHRPPVGPARIGRRPGTLELPFKTLTGSIDGFAQVNGPSITQLPGPRTELVAPISRGITGHTRQQGISSQCRQPLRRRKGRLIETQLLRHVTRADQQAGRGNGRCRDRRPERTMHRMGLIAAFRLARQFTQQAVIKIQHRMLSATGRR